MTPEEAQRFRLSNNLGGTSEVIYHLAIKKIYGEQYLDVIEGIKRHPAVAVPVVLNRLKQKEDEWRKAQVQFFFFFHQFFFSSFFSKKKCKIA